MAETPNKNDKKTTTLLDERGKFAVGNPGGPGRPPGSGYKQKFETMLTQVAKEKNITREEAELDLFKVAYEQALKGNYQFFKDYVDRAYGPVKQQTDTTVNVVIPILGGASVQGNDSHPNYIEPQEED